MNLLSSENTARLYPGARHTARDFHGPRGSAVGRRRAVVRGRDLSLERDIELPQDIRRHLLDIFPPNNVFQQNVFF